MKERVRDHCFLSESPRLVRADGEGDRTCHSRAGAQKSAVLGCAVCMFFPVFGPWAGGGEEHGRDGRRFPIAESRASREAATGPKGLLEPEKRRTFARRAQPGWYRDIYADICRPRKHVRGRFFIPRRPAASDGVRSLVRGVPRRKAGKETLCRKPQDSNTAFMRSRAGS